jgi:DNA-binding MarR family transcriptional regulator
VWCGALRRDAEPRGAKGFAQFYCVPIRPASIFSKTRVVFSAKYVNMADLISKPSARGLRTSGAAAAHGSEAAPDDLVAIIELIFFAYRDFTREPDAILETYGLGRAHHRVLHFINRRPGLRVSDLLDVLKITKQSLNRVLRPLYADAWIEAREGKDDRRERNLHLTPRGKVLADHLLALQMARVSGALKTLDAAARGAPIVNGDARGPTSDQAVAFLKAMLSEPDEKARGTS